MWVGWGLQFRVGVVRVRFPGWVAFEQIPAGGKDRSVQTCGGGGRSQRGDSPCKGPGPWGQAGSFVGWQDSGAGHAFLLCP